MWAVPPSQSAEINPIVGPASPMTINIGLLLPLTGSFSDTGITAQATIDVAKEDFQREFPNVTIHEVIADTATDPATALAQIQTLAAQGIRMFIGPFTSGEVTAVKPFADANNLVLISPTSSAPSLSVDDSIFRISLDDSKQAIALSAYINKHGVTAIVPIVRNDLYGTEFVEHFISEFQALTGTTATPIFYDSATPDIATAVNQVKTSVNAILQQNPTAVIGVLAVSFDEIVDIFKAASGDTVLSSLHWFGTDSSTENANVALDPIAAAFAEQIQFTSSDTADGNVAYFPYMPFLPIQENLVTKVLAKNATLNLSRIAPTYDAFWIAGMACFDPTANLKDEVVRVSKLTGGHMATINFGPTGDRSDGWYGFYRFMNGKWVLCATYTFTDFYVIPEPLVEKVFDFSTVSTEKVIKIGVLLPMTGSYSSYGQEMTEVLQKAEIDINTVIRRYYTSPTSRVEYVIEDTQTNPETAYQKLVSMKAQGIEFVIGPLTSAEVERVAPYANENGIILISPASTAMSLAQQDFIFRLPLNDAQHCASLAMLMQVEGFEFAEIVYRNDTFGNSFKEYFTNYFAAMGGTCGAGFSYDPSTTDFGSIIAQAETSVTNAAVNYGANRTAVLFIAYDEAIPFIEAISPNSILSRVRWFGTDGFTQSPLFAQSPVAGAFAAETELTASTLGNDAHMMSIYQQVMHNDITDYTGEEVRAFDVLAYDAAWLIAQFSIFSDWYPSADPISRVTNFATIATYTASYYSINVLDDNGDRSVGSIAFYQVQPKGSTVEWIKYAGFLVYLGPSGPFYFDQGPSAFVPFAEQFK